MTSSYVLHPYVLHPYMLHPHTLQRSSASADTLVAAIFKVNATLNIAYATITYALLLHSHTHIRYIHIHISATFTYIEYSRCYIHIRSYHTYTPALSDTHSPIRSMLQHMYVYTQVILVLIRQALEGQAPRAAAHTCGTTDAASCLLS